MLSIPRNPALLSDESSPTHDGRSAKPPQRRRRGARGFISHFCVIRPHHKTKAQRLVANCCRMERQRKTMKQWNEESDEDDVQVFGQTIQDAQSSAGKTNDDTLSARSRAQWSDATKSSDDDDEIVTLSQSKKRPRRLVLPMISKSGKNDDDDDDDESYSYHEESSSIGDNESETSDSNRPIRSAKRPTSSWKKLRQEPSDASTNSFFTINPKVQRYVFSQVQSQAKPTMENLLRQLQEHGQGHDADDASRRILMSYRQYTDRMVQSARPVVSQARIPTSKYVKVQTHPGEDLNHLLQHTEQCLLKNQQDVMSYQLQVRNLEEQLQQAEKEQSQMVARKTELEREIIEQQKQRDQLHPLLLSASSSLSGNYPSAANYGQAQSSRASSSEQTKFVMVERAPKSYMNKLLNGLKSPYDWH